MRKVYTIKDAARLIGIHPKTIRRWEEKGKFIPRRTLGNQRRFNETDLKILDQIKNGREIEAPKTKLLTAAAVAQKFQVSPATVQRWTKEGKLRPAVSDDLRPGFREDEIKRHLQGPTLQVEEPTGSVLVGVPTRTDPAGKYWLYAGAAGLALSLIAGIYLLLNRPAKIASPGINQAQPPTVDVSLPRTAQFLDGRISLGLNSGDLFYADTGGNIYVKDSALVENGVFTRSLQLLPAQAPAEKQIGQMYVDQTSGNLKYFDGLDWIDLNKTPVASGGANLSHTIIEENQDFDLTLGGANASASAASLRITLAGDQSMVKILGGANQDILTLNDDSLTPILMSQPTRILGNLTAPKFIDEDNSGYFLDPSNAEVSLAVAGDATISAALKFSKNGESIANSVDDYLIFSGGIGIAGGTKYGFASNGNIEAHKMYARDYMETDTVKIDDNLIKATNDGGLKLFDNSDRGITIADGGAVTINGTAVGAPDYVFEPGYELLSPVDLRNYLTLFQHLPGVPSASEIEAGGLNLAETMMAILERVENNTLYILDLYDRIDKLKTPLASDQFSAKVIESQMIKPMNNEDIINITGSVAITGDATVSGTLYAKVIESTTIEKLREKIAELAEKTSKDQRSDPLEGSDLRHPNLSGFTASPAAALAEAGYLALSTLESDTAFFKDYLAVLGQTTLTDVKINNLLTVSSITSTSGGINFLAGLMSLDESGLVKINGDLTVTGLARLNEVTAATLIAQNITPPPGEDLEINIASGAAVSIYADVGPVATFSAAGVRLNQLSLETSGTATVSAGANAVVLSEPKMTPNSQVVVTFTSDSKPATKYWVKKEPELGQFTVFTNYPVNADTTLDWLMVN